MKIYRSKDTGFIAYECPHNPKKVYSFADTSIDLPRAKRIAAGYKYIPWKLKHHPELELLCELEP